MRRVFAGGRWQCLSVNAHRDGDDLGGREDQHAHVVENAVALCKGLAVRQGVARVFRMEDDHHGPDSHRHIDKGECAPVRSHNTVARILRQVSHLQLQKRATVCMHTVHRPYDTERQREKEKEKA
jgi:hypothetical protein